MCEMTVRAFAWSPAIKNAMSKTKNPHFLGFTGRGEEITNEEVDNREVRYKPISRVHNSSKKYIVGVQED